MFPWQPAGGYTSHALLAAELSPLRIPAVMVALSALEVVPVSSVLPIMAAAILCVWAAHTSPVSPKEVAFSSELSFPPDLSFMLCF